MPQSPPDRTAPYKQLTDRPSSNQGVVRHESDVELEGTVDLRWRNLLSHDQCASSGVTLGVAELPVGGVAPDRHHHATPEAYYILQGTGRLEIDGQVFQVRAGHAAYIPNGAVHRLANIGSEVLRLLYVFPVDSFGEVHYEYLPEDGGPSQLEH